MCCRVWNFTGLQSWVAHAFPEQVCAQFGITCLHLLLTYKKATKIELNHEQPGDTFIMVPQGNGELKPKRFAHCSVEDLRKALAELRTPTPTKPIPAEDRALYDHYLEAVTSRFPTGTPVRVQMRSHEGETVITFKDIPISQVDKLTEALLDKLYPVREVPEVVQAPQPMQASQ